MTIEPKHKFWRYLGNMLWEHTKTSRTCLPNSSSRTINWADNIVAIQEIEPGRKQCCDTELWMCRRVTSSGPLRHWETGNSTAYGRLGQRPQGRMNSILSWKLVVPHFVPEIWMNRKTKSLNIKYWQKCSSWGWTWVIINGMMALGSTSRTPLQKALKKEMADQSNAMHIAAAYQQISPKTIDGWLQMNFHHCSTT